MMLAPPTRLSCYCGGIRLVVFARIRAPINCHCSQCRRLSGAAFTTWVTVRRGDMQIEGATLAGRFCLSANVLRCFCTCCGTHVWSEDRRRPGVFGLPGGLFAPEELPRPAADCFVEDQVDWSAASASTASTRRVSQQSPAGAAAVRAGPPL